MIAGSSTIGGAAGRAAAAGAGVGSLYARVGGAAAVDGMVGRFHRLVFGDGDLRAYFGAEVAELRWHQTAQLTRVLGGPDWYQGAGACAAYLPLVVRSELFHRAAFYLVRAVDVAGSREVVLAVASALAARRCRIIGGFPVAGVLVAPAVASVEGVW